MVFGVGHSYASHIWLRQTLVAMATKFWDFNTKLAITQLVQEIRPRCLHLLGGFRGFFDCVRGMGPTYFTRVCVPVSDNTARSSLHSAQRGDFFVPRTRTKLGARSFRVAAPTVWNSLPTELRSTSVSRDTFKSRMKSHFYADAYLHQV